MRVPVVAICANTVRAESSLRSKRSRSVAQRSLRLRRFAPALRLTGFLSFLLMGAAAHAWPVDVAITVPAGDIHFERPAAIDWAEIEDPKVATLEVLHS